MEPVRCLTCGYIIGAYYDAFIYMKGIMLAEKAQDIHIDKKLIDPDSNDNLIPIYEALNIKKYCCRGQLISCRNMNDIGY